MSILDKAKSISNKVVNSVTEFSSDNLIADTIIKAVEKQESINSILKSKGCNYRITDVDLGAGLPPSVSFGIRRINNEENTTEVTNSTNSNKNVQE